MSFSCSDEPCVWLMLCAGGSSCCMWCCDLPNQAPWDSNLQNMMGIGTQFKSVMLFFFFPATDKSMLICQPQLWNVPTAWTIFCTTLVFFVKAFFYWSELTCAEKPCEFNANCYWALTVSSRAIQKDAVGVDVQCMYFKTCLPVLIFSLILLSEYKQVVN